MTQPSLTIPLSLINFERQEELELLLKPISADQPCGPPMRYDPVFTEIRLAREEDDPSLPMGQWERPLKRADWAFIESRAKEMLVSRSKDLQIAAWLLEAWTRQFGFEGLYRGLSLVERLVRDYWPTLHPVIEDDDCDARIAPLEWLNESLSATLKVQVPLLNMAGRKPPKITFADWESMTAKELAGPTHAVDRRNNSSNNAPEPDAPLTREEVTAYAQKHLVTDLDTKVRLINHSLTCLKATLATVDGQLGMDAPNLSKLKGTLEAIERVLTHLLPEKKEPEMIPEIVPDDSGDAVEGAAPAPAPSAVTVAGWKSRHEAYATLSALADYLSMVEPHSPTPYLLRRAVNWGRMPLPELMAEIIREEGDLNRLMNVLGLQNE